MWPDLRKGVFHTHPILWTWKPITLWSRKIQAWNFLHLLTYDCNQCWPNLKAIPLPNLMFWFSKVGKLDVCGRPLFANPVTYDLYIGLLTLYEVAYSVILTFIHIKSRKPILTSEFRSKSDIEDCMRISNVFNCTVNLCVFTHVHM